MRKGAFLNRKEMVFHYLSVKRFNIDSVPLEFGASRDAVRIKLGGSHKEDNRVISLGDSDASLTQRRDIYDSIDSTGDYFFLNYDESDLLTELEIHRCKMIQVFDFSFDFEDEIEYVASELSRFSQVKKKGEGEYFFKDLHISIIDEMRMGGEEESTMSYFYCASDVSHLED